MRRRPTSKTTIKLRTPSTNVARWLGDIRQYFPSSVVQVMQKDALDRLNLKQMLFEPELLRTVEPDVHLVSQLLALSTKMVVFDTAVVDLTQKLADPVDLLFRTQLGGGTNFNRALAYCQSLARQPQEIILVLISDLCEGGDAKEMLKRVSSLAASGVQMISLLALNDDGGPMFDKNHAAAFAALDIRAFACTPDLFPDLMAAAIQRQDLMRWTASQGIAASKPRG
jgi:hypothetical protein